MEYYVVDKCRKAFDHYKLNIYYAKNNDIGATLKPISSCTTDESKFSYYNYDFTKPVVHTLYNKALDCDENKVKDNFDKLYIKNVTVAPYIVGLIDIYEEGDCNKIKYTYDNLFSKSYPKIVLTYTISTKPTNSKCCTDKCNEFTTDGNEYVHSFKPDNFENSIDLHLTATKDIKTCSLNGLIVGEKLKCNIDTRLTGSSKIIFNGEEYLFDSNEVTKIYCLYESSCGDEIRWTFICVAKLLNTSKPITTKVSEEEFKLTDKHNADIVIVKDKTFLIKGTTNNNTVFDYSYIKDNKDLISYIDIVHPEYYLSNCRNCNNCYDCKYCWNCNNCEYCELCKNCDTCVKCYNSQYCDNISNISGKTDISNINTFKTNTYEYCNTNIYTKYISQFNTKSRHDKKLYVAMALTAVVTTLSIMYYMWTK